jgi:hypothetical protein
MTCVTAGPLSSLASWVDTVLTGGVRQAPLRDVLAFGVPALALAKVALRLKKEESLRFAGRSVDRPWRRNCLTVKCEITHYREAFRHGSRQRDHRQYSLARKHGMDLPMVIVAHQRRVGNLGGNP